jgi:hypothetical protein
MLEVSRTPIMISKFKKKNRVTINEGNILKILKNKIDHKNQRVI